VLNSYNQVVIVEHPKYIIAYSITNIFYAVVKTLIDLSYDPETIYPIEDEVNSNIAVLAKY